MRCFVANAELYRTTNKVGKTITFHQRNLIKTIAFATTLEKLENRNYEDVKKIIYLSKK